MCVVTLDTSLVWKISSINNHHFKFYFAAKSSTIIDCEAMKVWIRWITLKTKVIKVCKQFTICKKTAYLTRGYSKHCWSCISLNWPLQLRNTPMDQVLPTILQTLFVPNLLPLPKARYFFLLILFFFFFFSFNIA